MRRPLCIAIGISLLGGPSLLGVEKAITTQSGKRYVECEVLKHDSHGVIFRHRDGMAKVAFADLPEETLKQLDISSSDAGEQPARNPRKEKVKQTAKTAGEAKPKRAGAQRISFVPLRHRPAPRRTIWNPYLLSGVVPNRAANAAYFGGWRQFLY